MKSLFAVILFSIFFISCSNVAEVEAVPEVRDTLKSVVLDKENNITWSKELEGSRLSENIYSDSEHISDFYVVSPENVIVSHKKDPAIYPELIGFGSLDTTSIPYGVNQLINNFCKTISENFYGSGEQFFDSNYYFDYIFFKNDLKNSWKERFGIDFPVEAESRDDDPQDGDNPGVDESIQSEETVLSGKTGHAGKTDHAEKIEPAPLFNKWIIGKSFTTGEITQVPVRLYCQQGYVDVTLYINLNSNKIFQIEEGPYAGKK